MKIVINRCYGGFGLSEQAVIRYHEILGIPVWVEHDSKFASMGITHYWLVPPEQRVENQEDRWHTMTLEERQEYNLQWRQQTFHPGSVNRADTTLVQVVEELGTAANSRFSELKVVEIPDGVDWEIDEYDGIEHVAERHRTWS